MNPQPDRLSLTQYRAVDPQTLTYEEYLNFVFAQLLQDMLATVEIAIPSDRAFNSAKYKILTAFHDARAKLDDDTTTTTTWTG